eukprot:IDg6035t1
MGLELGLGADRDFAIGASILAFCSAGCLRLMLAAVKMVLSGGSRVEYNVAKLARKLVLLAKNGVLLLSFAPA